MIVFKYEYCNHDSHGKIYPISRDDLINNMSNILNEEFNNYLKNNAGFISLFKTKEDAFEADRASFARFLQPRVIRISKYDLSSDDVENMIFSLELEKFPLQDWIYIFNPETDKLEEFKLKAFL